jgi:hypothetical protein
MPRRYPDYAKLVKRVGLIYVGWIVVWVPLVLLVHATAPPNWVSAIAIVAPLLGFLLALVLVIRAFVGEERQCRQVRQPTGPGEDRRRTTLASMLRLMGVPAFVFTCVAMLGLPLTLIGAVWHVQRVLELGLVLLVAELLDLAVIIPARGARRRSSR